MSAEYNGPEIYAFQPFGMDNKEHWKAGRIYAVVGFGEFGLTKIEGLTKEEAQDIAKFLMERKNSKPLAPTESKDGSGT
jgi:hypothetical protein